MSQKAEKAFVAYSRDNMTGYVVIRSYGEMEAIHETNRRFPHERMECKWIPEETVRELARLVPQPWPMTRAGGKVRRRFFRLTKLVPYLGCVAWRLPEPNLCMQLRVREDELTGPWCIQERPHGVKCECGRVHSFWLDYQ